MKQSVLTSARLLQEQHQKGGVRYKVAMVTLTYRFEFAWKAGQLSEYINRVKSWAFRKGFKISYVWVCELTQSGRPHYHVLIWLPKGATMPMADKQGWWSHGSTRTEWARHAVGYIAKYASKGSTGDYDKGARICGSAGLDLARRIERRWWLSPRYVREKFTSCEQPVRAAGGGWVSRVTGEWVESEWVLVSVGPAYVRLGRRDELLPSLQSSPLIGPSLH